MLIDKNTPEIESYRIFDCTDRAIPFVQSYNTETKEIVLHLVIEHTQEDNKTLPPVICVPTETPNTVAPVTVSFTLDGSYATKDGQKVE